MRERVARARVGARPLTAGRNCGPQRRTRRRERRGHSMTELQEACGPRITCYTPLPRSRLGPQCSDTVISVKVTTEATDVGRGE